MKLVLVESPTKARTLSQFLGKDFQIEATMGHIRDLPKGEIGVDTKKNFKPRYVIPRDKLKRVNQLRKLAQDKELIILAMDPDREGEAIAYHMAVILSQKGTRITTDKIINNKFSRIVFHEITKSAINQALKSPSKIDNQLVDAQQARRVLDRLVGYELSPLLWKKLSRRWLSAGRVQSVALRLIAEREREISGFKSKEYWVISGQFSPSSADKKTELVAKLVSKDGKKYDQSVTLKLFDGDYTYRSTSIKNQAAAEKIIANFKSPFLVSAVDKKEIARNPPPPFTTSSLQINVGRKLGYSSKRTMRLAQNLYERGLITYHRTDSVSLAGKFLQSAKKYIEKEYGKKYSQFRTYATKSKLAQEAHEAIRPTRVNTRSLTLSASKGLRAEHQKLYDMIWKRAVASQAAAAILDRTTIEMKSDNGYLFKTQGSVIKFDGYLKITRRELESQLLPKVALGDKLKLNKSIPDQKFTQPPPRYSEASLVKALEENGIGRPSTYAPTISTIQTRQYIEKETLPDGSRGRKFVPTDLGVLVNDFLVKHFTNIVDLFFTAHIEEDLDEIASGTSKWEPVVEDFYTPFHQKITDVEKNAKKVKAPVEKTGKKCPECKKGQLVIKQGRYGKFMACSRFPDCKHTQNIIEKVGKKCPKCKKGDIVIKRTRKKRMFYGCSKYPGCEFASWKKPK